MSPSGLLVHCLAFVVSQRALHICPTHTLFPAKYWHGAHVFCLPCWSLSCFDVVRRLIVTCAQSSSVQEFSANRPVFDAESLSARRQTVPGRFLRSLWLMSFKPVYDMDFKTFARKAPLMPVLNVCLSS